MARQTAIRLALVAALVASAAIVILATAWAPRKSSLALENELAARARTERARARAPSASAELPRRQAGAAVALPPAGSALLPVLEDLKQQSSLGNAAAACRLAFELDRCARVNHYRMMAADAISRAESAGLFGDLLRKQAALAEKAQNEFYRVSDICEGVPQAETAQAWKHLLQAVRAGHGPSMAVYVGESGYLRDRPVVEVLDGWMAYRDIGPEVLKRAVEMGYPSAYLVASRGYAEGNYFGLPLPRDPGLAAALALALARSKDDPHAEQRQIAALVERGQTNDDDLARGRSLASHYLGLLRARARPGVVPGRRDGEHCEG